MTIEATPVAAGVDAQPSQIIDPSASDAGAAGRGVSLPEADAPKPEPKLSTRDAIAKAFDEAAEASAKDKAAAAVKDAGEKVKEAEKAEPKPAPVRTEGGKFAKAEQPEGEPAKADPSAAEKPAPGQEAADKSRQSEGRQHQEPPARFLPEARTKWANVPNEVKAEFHRVSQEYEGELTKAKQVTERYEPIRQFDEIAKQNGRELKDSLAKAVEIEQSIARNPVAGLDAVLREIGPRKADGSPVSLYEVAQGIARMTPQQYAQMIGGQQAQPQARQTQQVDPELAALKSELSEVKSTLAQQRAAPIIESFAASHPDYHAIEPQIAAVLKSGVVEQIYGSGLSPAQKLEQAYRMAGGSSPSQSQPEPAPQHSEAPAAALPVDLDGHKSVRGAPTSGQTGESPRKFKTNRAALEAAFASVR